MRFFHDGGRRAGADTGHRCVCMASATSFFHYIQAPNKSHGKSGRWLTNRKVSAAVFPNTPRYIDSRQLRNRTKTHPIHETRKKFDIDACMTRCNKASLSGETKASSFRMFCMKLTECSDNPKAYIPISGSVPKPPGMTGEKNGIFPDALNTRENPSFMTERSIFLLAFHYLNNRSFISRHGVMISWLPRSAAFMECSPMKKPDRHGRTCIHPDRSGFP